MGDSGAMKLIRSLFQILLLVVLLIVLSHPLRADTSGGKQGGSPAVQTAVTGKGKVMHHMFSILLTNAESGFM